MLFGCGWCNDVNKHCRESVRPSFRQHVKGRKGRELYFGLFPSQIALDPYHVRPGGRVERGTGPVSSSVPISSIGRFEEKFFALVARFHFARFN
jgi:hypothetical protein